MFYDTALSSLLVREVVFKKWPSLMLTVVY